MGMFFPAMVNLFLELMVSLGTPSELRSHLKYSSWWSYLQRWWTTANVPYKTPDPRLTTLSGSWSNHRTTSMDTTHTFFFLSLTPISRNHSGFYSNFVVFHQNNKYQEMLVVLKKSLQLQTKCGQLDFLVRHPFTSWFLLLTLGFVLESPRSCIISEVSQICMKPPGMNQSQLQIALAKLISTHQYWNPLWSKNINSSTSMS